MKKWEEQLALVLVEQMTCQTNILANIVAILAMVTGGSKSELRDEIKGMIKEVKAKVDDGNVRAMLVVDLISEQAVK